MRPIKFRAWDKNTQSYIETPFDIRIDGSGYIYRRAWGESVWEQTSDIDIEFFTGLKATKSYRTGKHSKEIYEGDIVHSKWVDVKYQYGEEETTTVKYEKGAFWLTCTLDGYDTNWLEIIGTIHDEEARE